MKTVIIYSPSCVQYIVYNTLDAFLNTKEDILKNVGNQTV